jgi:hypothetical protein
MKSPQTKERRFRRNGRLTGRGTMFSVKTLTISGADMNYENAYRETLAEYAECVSDYIDAQDVLSENSMVTDILRIEKINETAKKEIAEMKTAENFADMENIYKI